MKIIISRTDNIGDVVLTLPLCGVIKQHMPWAQILFLCRSYTQPIVAACSHVDEIIVWESIKHMPLHKQIHLFKSFKADAIIHVFPHKHIALVATLANIQIKIGTSHRWFHWILCNKKVHLNRSQSLLHEAQLNLRLLKPLSIPHDLALNQLPDFYGIKKTIVCSQSEKKHLHSHCRVILHPRTNNSSREWGEHNFMKLIDLLPKNLFDIYITGTASERQSLNPILSTYAKKIHDCVGTLSLKELIDLIQTTDALVAASTGPLHIAAAYGVYTIGLYPPIKPLHPGRWAPIGKHVDIVVIDTVCTTCRGKKFCKCIQSIPADVIAEKLISYQKMLSMK